MLSIQYIVEKMKKTICFFIAFIALFSNGFANEMDRLITYISENHEHAGDDDYLSYEEAKKVIKKRKLRMTCGSISNFAVNYLTEKGIKCRFILTLTLEEWNNNNNGHSMVEVYHKGRWYLLDIDLKNIFLLNGQQIDANTFCKISDSESFEIVKFCNGEVMAPDQRNTWFGDLFSTEEGFRWFYKRCCQVNMIREKGGVFFFTSDQKNASRILSYLYCGPFSYMDEKKFMQTFYQ